MKTPRPSPLRYLFRNFFVMCPLAILPAGLLAFAQGSDTTYSPIEFLLSQLHVPTPLKVNDFSLDVYKYFTGFNFTPLWWIFALGVIAFVIALCVITPIVERHMRLGVRSYGRLISLFNDSALMVIPYFLLMAVSYEFVSLMISGAIYLLIMLNVSGVALFALCCLIIAGLYGLYIAFLVLTICSVPSMMTDGYKFNVAVSYSAKLVAKKLKRLYFRFICVIIVTNLIVAVTKYFLSIQALDPIFHIVVSFVYYLFWTMYLPVMSMATYIDLTEGQRKDLKVELF